MEQAAQERLRADIERKDMEPGGIIDIPAKEELHQTIRRFNLAFSGVEKKRVNPFTKSNYANWDDVAEAILPTLETVGLFYQFELGMMDGRPLLGLRITNRDGASIEHEIELPAETDSQKFGSRLTYLKRQLLSLALNIRGLDDDDDGNKTKDKKEREKLNPLDDGSDITPKTLADAKSFVTSILKVLAGDVEDDLKASAILDLRNEMNLDKAVFTTAWGMLDSKTRSAFKKYVKLAGG